MSARCTLGLALTVLGCTVSAQDQAPIVQAPNRCENDTVCGPEGQCVEKRCEATNGKLPALLFEISIPSTYASSSFANRTFLIHRTDLQTQLEPGPRTDPQTDPQTDVSYTRGTLDLELPEMAVVTGRVELANSRLGCDQYDFAQNPLKITLTPKRKWVGLTVAPVTTTAGCPDPGCVPEFSVSLPSGEYDLYVEPDTTQMVVGRMTEPGPAVTGCGLPPEARQVTLEGLMELGVLLSEPDRLALIVRWPIKRGPNKLDGWTVDMLDSVTGRPLSTRLELSQPSLDSTKEYQEYAANLEYVGNNRAESEFVRLAPPKDTTAPTVLVPRSALQLLTNTPVFNFTQLPDPVRIEGTLIEGEGDAIVGSPGTVALTAKELEGIDSGTMASFGRSVQAQEDGSFQVDLLPGTYRVRATPPERWTRCPDGQKSCDCPLRSTEDEWVVGRTPSLQAGKTVALSRRAAITGSVTTNLGPASGASIRLSPQPVAADVLSSALGQVPVGARAAAGSVDASGQFQVLVDPGRFQLAIRPEQSSGFPWLVRREVSVEDPANGTLDLGPLSAPLPVVYTGAVTAWGGATWFVLPDAVIKAYVVPVSSVSGGQVSRSSGSSPVVQVAEVRANSKGVFELLVPASLDESAPSTESGY
jgi:hypothetical protein